MESKSRFSKAKRSAKLSTWIKEMMIQLRTI